MTVADRELRASAPSLSDDEMGALAADPSPRVRRVVAGRDDLTASAAGALAGDRDREVRERLADNPACPAGLLGHLMDDPLWRVRWTAAQNTSPDPAVRETALRSPRPDVREALARRRDLTLEMSTALAGDPHVDVRLQLLWSSPWQQIPVHLAADPSPRVRAEVAGSDRVTGTPLRELASDKTAAVRAAAAGNPRTPRDVVMNLARDRSTAVRRALVALRPGDPEVSAALRDDPEPDIARRAGRRP
ncbi:hypothetical protein AB6N24_03635 [Cellulomonas sp. 179-A 4D5 NHS]|uniref:hypothetical protein n=1 Tax=Cellulomonas sp. 179-A 4D5 NHS TaxID=3142378 RepID=UPI0039A28687